MNKNKSQKISIKIWREGKTEEYYFKSLFGATQLKNIKLEYKNLKNGNYKPIKTLLEKEKYYDKILIVIDLDRANNDRKQELPNLKNLIRTIKKSKDIFLFLIYQNFEDWLRFHFVDRATDSKKNFYAKLGKKSENDFKLNTKDLFSQIINHGGKIEYAENYFKSKYLFCDRKYNIVENNIDKLQSNLYYFRELLQNIDSSITK